MTLFFTLLLMDNLREKKLTLVTSFPRLLKQTYRPVFADRIRNPISLPPSVSNDKMAVVMVRDKQEIISHKSLIETRD